MKNWQKLLDEGKLKIEPVNAREISDRIVGARRYSDQALLSNIDLDIRYDLAYTSARKWCEIVVRAEGLRVKGILGHHELLISAVGFYLGKEKNRVVLYLDKARKHRNNILYENNIGITTDEELAYLLVSP